MQRVCRKWLPMLLALLLSAAALSGCEKKPQETEPLPPQDQTGTCQTAEAAMKQAKDVLNKLAQDAGLEALAADVTMTPIAARGTGTLASSFKDGVAAFTYTEGKNTVTYTVDTNRDKVKKGVIEVLVSFNGGTQTTAVTDAGTMYLTKEGKKLTPKKLAETAVVSMTAKFEEATGHLALDYMEQIEDTEIRKTFDFFLLGASLAIQATSADEKGEGGYCGFYTGGTEGLTDPSIMSVMYVEEVSATVVKQGSETPYFLTAYVDKAKTFGTRVSNTPDCGKTSTSHGMTVNYELNSAGKTNPLHELFYVTASDQILNCVSLNNAEKDAYRDSLNNLVVYDSWGQPSYRNRIESTSALVEKYNLKDILYVEHRWQRDKLDISTPAHYPANTDWGTAEDFAALLKSLRDSGWRPALHEDYWFMNPTETNQYWNVEKVEQYLAQNADGTLRPGWLSSPAIKSDRMKYYSDIESKLIKENYKTDAVFLDVNGGNDPSILNQLTFNAESKTARTLAQVVADNVTLFESMKSIYGGPIISESTSGGVQARSLYAGYMDAHAREITGNSNARIMPDYELIYIRSLMANEGMGPPARFQTDTASEPYNFDRYNAFALAYGHTGFIGEVHLGNPAFEKEIVNVYYTFRAVQEEYLDTSNAVREIYYYTDEGKRLKLDQAILAGYDFTQSKLYIRYTNGLEMCINFSDDIWKAIVNGKTYSLDKYGFAAANDITGLELYSALIDGMRVDYCKCKDYTYANPRGNLVKFEEGMTIESLLIKCADGFEINPVSAVTIEPIQYTDLVTFENGANGLTFYWTDGKTLTPFAVDEATTGNDKGWRHGTDGVLVYPVTVKQDNYGCAGTSESEYVVFGYKLPASGAIDLWTWTVLQGPSGDHGYEVRIALNSLDNVVRTFQLTGNTQTQEAHTYSLKVNKGDELLMIYEPLVKKNQEWFGYKTVVTYTMMGDDIGEVTDPIEVGHVVRFTDLASDQNGKDGLYFYYTSDGKTLTEFTEYAEGEKKWYHGGDGVLVYPALNPADNYGAAGSSETEYVVIGYKIPESGLVDLFAWTALQGPAGEHGYHIKVAVGDPENVVVSYDNIGDTQNVIANTYKLKVLKDQMLYILYEPEVKKNGEWFGFINQLTYTAIGEDVEDPNQPVEPGIQEGTVIKLTALVTEENGGNGLHYYYTSDGKTLTPFTEYDAGQKKWYQGSGGLLIYPVLNPNDNYGAAGSDAENYVVIGYEIPSGGTVDLFAWTALQGPSGEHGYRVKIALGTPDNVVASYENIGDTQNVIANTYTLDVKKGEMLYFVYESVVKKDGEWFGFINQLTYKSVNDAEVEPEPAVKKGDVIKLVQETIPAENGGNGVYWYYTSDGKELTPFTDFAEGENKWYHGGNGVLIYPALNPNDNYGAAGSDETDYVVIGYKLPASGKIDLFSWTALQGPAGEHGYHVKVALGRPTNIVASYDNIGDTQNIVANTYSLKVEEGKMLYLIYEPVTKKNGEWFGFINQITYTAIDPEIKEGDVIKLTALVTPTNGENGLHWYYTSDGKELTEFTDYAEGEGKWYHGGNGVLVYPALNPTDNYGVAGSDTSDYVVLGYEIPASGTIDLFAWTALQGPAGEHGYRVKIALGDPENVVESYDNIGDTQNIVANTYTLKVKKNEMLYLIYEPVVKKDAEWFGFINQITYKTLDPVISEGSVIKLTALVTEENGGNGLHWYYTPDGKTMNEFTDYLADEKKWVHESGGGLLIYPVLNPGDNYGVAGTSEKYYVAIGYEIPEDGRVKVFAWTALQGPSGEHGYHVRIAHGTPANVVATYDNIGDTQNIVANTYEIEVDKGKMLYFIYEPVTMKDAEWFGFINQITYVEVY